MKIDSFERTWVVVFYPFCDLLNHVVDFKIFLENVVVAKKSKNCIGDKNITYDNDCLLLWVRIYGFSLQKVCFNPHIDLLNVLILFKWPIAIRLV